MVPWETQSIAGNGKTTNNSIPASKGGAGGWGGEGVLQGGRVLAENFSASCT